MRLGTQRVRLNAGEAGTVVAWQRPLFRVQLDRGNAIELRASDLTALLRVSREDFLDPRNFYFDFAVIRAADVPGWADHLDAYLLHFGASLDPLWSRCTATCERAPRDGRPRGPNDIRAAFLALAGESRAPRTVRNQRNYAEKLLWWLAANGRRLPPSAWDVTEYLTILAEDRGTCGAVAGTRGALLHLARINNWDPSPYCEGSPLVPGAALARRNRHQVKKSDGLTADMVDRIIDAYCYVRPNRPASHQWELAIGSAIAIAFKEMARWDDAGLLLWDEGKCWVLPWSVLFGIDKRKNAQFEGNILDIARPLDPSQRGVYHVAVFARNFFRTGHVLPFISASGAVDTSRPMPYASFVRHLRACLEHIGLRPDEARRFAGQSARAGAATEAVYAGLDPRDVCRLAGVSSINWSLGYMRPDSPHRLRASRALGL